MAPQREPIHDVHPLTGVNIEMFFADHKLETFGRGKAGWLWWPRQRGFSPDGPATGPFATSYAAYRDATTTVPTTVDDVRTLGEQSDALHVPTVGYRLAGMG